MGRVSVTRPTRARLGYLTGLFILAVGLYLALGEGWALVALGVGICAAFVFLYDTDEPDSGIRNVTRGDDW